MVYFGKCHVKQTHITNSLIIIFYRGPEYCLRLPLFIPHKALVLYSHSEEQHSVIMILYRDTGFALVIAFTELLQLAVTSCSKYNTCSNARALQSS
jgi:hypothetical protein